MDEQDELANYFRSIGMNDNQSFEYLALLIQQSNDMASISSADQDMADKLRSALDVDYLGVELLIQTLKQALIQFAENIQAQE